MRLSLALTLLVWTAGCGEQQIVLFGIDSATGVDASGDAGDTAPVSVVDRDPERCGVAEVHCQDDEYCVDGGCVCRQGLIPGDEGCIDPASDGERCGTSGTTCTGVCSAGTCISACPAGTTTCEGGCVDTRSHPLHCGECERRCGAGSVCVEGRCVPFRPAPCTTCPCTLCGTRTCCIYPTTSDPICVDDPSCATGF